MAKNHFCNCGKKLSSYHSLWRHKKICKKEQEPKSDTGKEDIVGDIINKVVQRANMDVKPMTEKTPSLPKIPMQVVKALKPKSLTDLEVEMKSDSEESTSSEDETALKPKSLTELPAEMKSDSEEPTSSEDETEGEEIDYEVMPDNPEELKKAFRKLYKKFRRDIEIYNKLVLMLDELERIKCLTKEECNAVKNHLEKKIGNRD